MTRGNESRVGVACIHMQPQGGGNAGNMAHSAELIEQAHARGARLIVLPELCNSGYVFESREEASALSETLADGDSIRQWCALAARLGVTLVAGYAERDGDALYNAAAVIGPGGVLGGYRKMHLWGEEHLFFEAGNLG